MRRDNALEQMIVAKYAAVAPALNERARRLSSPKDGEFVPQYDDSKRLKSFERPRSAANPKIH